MPFILASADMRLKSLMGHMTAVRRLTTFDQTVKSNLASIEAAIKQSQYELKLYRLKLEK